MLKKMIHLIGIPKSISPLSHWIDTNLFGGGHDRVVFDVSSGPARARLRIYNVSEADDGIYREDECRTYIVRAVEVEQVEQLLYRLSRSRENGMCTILTCTI